MGVNSKQRATFDQVFATPIPWTDIESMVAAAGATVRQRRGSRVSFSLNGVVAVFHEPHPQRQAPQATVRGVRDFLERAGVTP